MHRSNPCLQEDLELVRKHRVELVIASKESMVAEGYKRMIVGSGMDDITLTRAFTGLETNVIRQSIETVGFNLTVSLSEI